MSGSGGGSGYAPPSRAPYGGGAAQQRNGAAGGGAQSNPGNVCRFGRQCHRDGCYYAHPDGREMDDGQGPPGGISAGPGARAKAPVSPTSGRSDFNPDEWEGDEEGKLEEEEAAALAALEQCECCGGRPLECQTPACRQAGRCFCTQGEAGEEGVDDSWSVLSLCTRPEASAACSNAVEQPCSPFLFVVCFVHFRRDEWFPDSRNCPCCAGSIYRCQKQQPDCVSGNCFCSLSKGK